jgi:hypothetical protein
LKGKRRIGFVLFLGIGNIALALYAFYYLGKDTVLESIAIFTSVSTAAYAVLNEPETVRPEPLLRVRPVARGGLGAGSLGLDLSLDNIGDALAKDVKVVCKTSPQVLPLQNNGIYLIESIVARERPVRINVVTSLESGQFPSQNLEVEVTYSNTENKKQNPIKKTYSIDELIRKLDEDTILKS